MLLLVLHDVISLLHSLSASDGISSVKCELTDLAVMNRLYNKRIAIIEAGIKSPDFWREDLLSLEACYRVKQDCFAIRKVSTEDSTVDLSEEGITEDEKQVKRMRYEAKPYWSVANNPFSECFFEFCAQHHYTKFPLYHTAFHNSGM